MPLYTIFIIPALSVVHLCFQNRHGLERISNVSLKYACSVLFFDFCFYFVQSTSGQINSSSKFEAVLSDFQSLLHTNLLSQADAVSVFFVLLSNVLVCVCVLLSSRHTTSMVKEFHLALHLINLLLMGVFCCSDVLLFYIFFETILIPVFLVITFFGVREERKKAAYYFFFYTLFGSVFMLLAMVDIYCQEGTLSIHSISSQSLRSQR